jgi:indolepyruvate ferredoxin oxidoreductase alpha subunit
VKDPRGFEELLARRLASNDLSVIVSRRPCILAAADIRHFEKVNAEKAAAASPCAACGSDDAT